MVAYLAILKCNLDIMSVPIIKMRFLVFSSSATVIEEKAD